MRKNSQNGIISLAVIFGAGIFALTGALTMALGMLGELTKNRNIIWGDQSFYTADAAAREGAYQFINASSSYTGGVPLLLNNSSTGTIQVASPAWPYVEITGEAGNQDIHRISLYILTLFPEALAFDHAVYAQNNLAFGGHIEVNGSVFANLGIEFNGNNAVINGNAYSPEYIEDSGNINGNITSGVEPIPAPQIDTDFYLNIATASSTFFADPNDAEAYLNGETREAVIFVNSILETKIRGSNTILAGSIVTFGDLSITGGNYTAWNNYAAIIVRGDLKIAGGAVINGIVHVSGSTSFGGGNNVINGALISAGGASVTDITGSATINYDPDIAASWENLTGLNTISAEEPRIVNWKER